MIAKDYEGKGSKQTDCGYQTVLWQKGKYVDE